MEAFHANAKDISDPKARQNASPGGARGLHNSQESKRLQRSPKLGRVRAVPILGAAETAAVSR